MVERFFGGEPLLRVEHQDPIDEVSEKLVNAAAEGAKVSPLTIENEKRAYAHVDHSARIERPLFGHMYFSCPSTPGSFSQPGIESEVGGPQALQKSMKSISSPALVRNGLGSRKDLDCLVKVGLAGEDRRALVHLGHDAAAA